MSADPDIMLLRGYAQKLERIKNLLLQEVEGLPPSIVDDINLFIQEINADIEDRNQKEKKVPNS